MAGLLQQGMQPAPEQAPQGQPMQGQPPQQPPQSGQPAQEVNDPRVNATPEEAGPQFEVLLEGMLGYLYGDGMQQAAQMLQQGDDITRRMGQVIGTVMVTTYNMIAQDGKTVPPNVMVRAGIELAKAVGEMAMEVGRLQPGEDEAIEAAFMLGLGLFGKTAEGLEDAQRQRYSEMVTAIQDGKRETVQGQQPPQQQPQGQPPQQPMMEGA
ncbi:hypothetical protein ACIGG6_02040 [Vreelandella lionensis]|uniref:Uncharacterized protein n=1 Tax=Vreelandella lionensis TaxID=1144478 RepID=A0ABW8BNH5_9GAMM